jgi:Protein phosphatase 2C
VAVVSDGAGSAACGGFGARLVVRSLVTQVRERLARGERLDDEALRSIIDHARDGIAFVAKDRALRPRDFAATMIAAVSTAAETVIAHVGDGAAVGEDADGAWLCLSWPSHGPYASTTYFVTDDELQLRIARFNTPLRTLALLTDGLERLALDFSTTTPHAPFFSAIAAPVQVSQAEGRDRRLSAALRTYLGSDKINARTDDDKTLLVAVMR